MAGKIPTARDVGIGHRVCLDSPQGFLGDHLDAVALLPGDHPASWPGGMRHHLCPSKSGFLVGRAIPCGQQCAWRTDAVGHERPVGMGKMDGSFRHIFLAKS